MGAWCDPGIIGCEPPRPCRPGAAGPAPKRSARSEGHAVASGVAESSSKNIEALLERVKANRSDYASWMQLAVAYREIGDHSHQVWAWSRAIKHGSKNRHCRKWGHLLRFNETPDQATCLYCGESFSLGSL